MQPDRSLLRLPQLLPESQQPVRSGTTAEPWPDACPELVPNPHRIVHAAPVRPPLPPPTPNGPVHPPQATNGPAHPSQAHREAIRGLPVPVGEPAPQLGPDLRPNLRPEPGPTERPGTERPRPTERPHPTERPGTAEHPGTERPRLVSPRGGPENGVPLPGERAVKHAGHVAGPVARAGRRAAEKPDAQPVGLTMPPQTGPADDETPPQILNLLTELKSDIPPGEGSFRDILPHA